MSLLPLVNWMLELPPEAIGSVAHGGFPAEQADEADGRLRRPQLIGMALDVQEGARILFDATVVKEQGVTEYATSFSRVYLERAPN